MPHSGTRTRCGNSFGHVSGLGLRCTCWRISATPLSFLSWIKMSTFVTLTFLCPLLADNLSEDHVEQTPIFFGEWEASWQTPGVRASSLLVIFPLSIPRVLCPCSFFSKSDTCVKMSCHDSLWARPWMLIPTPLNVLRSCAKS